MLRKPKVIILILILSIMTNMFLAYILFENNNETEYRRRIYRSKAIDSIDKTENNLRKLEGDWSKIDKTKKMEYLVYAESNIILAIELLQASDWSFLPLKECKIDVISLKNDMMKGESQDILRKNILEVSDKLRDVYMFLFEKIDYDMTSEEIYEIWKGESKERKSKWMLY